MEFSSCHVPDWLRALEMNRQITEAAAGSLSVLCRRHVAGGMPILRLNARLNAASDS
jgi:hypothetical protein